MSNDPQVWSMIETWQKKQACRCYPFTHTMTVIVRMMKDVNLFCQVGRQCKLRKHRLTHLTYNIFLAISLTVPRAGLCVVSSPKSFALFCSYCITEIIIDRIDLEYLLLYLHVPGLSEWKKRNCNKSLFTINQIFCRPELWKIAFST